MLAVLLSASTLQADGVTAYHVLRPGETLWFVAQVYYGDGNEFTKMLAANHLRKPEDVDVGQELVIPNPMWVETMPKFDDHFRALFHQRSVALARKHALKVQSEAALSTEQDRTPAAAKRSK